MGWGLILALMISFLIFYFLWRVMRNLAPLILHGILGLLVFWVLNYFGLLKVPIDLVTFLIASFGGVLGVLVVVAMAALGVPL
jgi:inhibitor of the pro-sigma K processing machinery